MQLIRGLHNLRPRHRGCVATIGNFDGVHLGHRAVFEALLACGRDLGVPAVVVIFEPQPLEFFRPADAPARLTRLREKLQALEGCGIHRVLLLEFNRFLAEKEEAPIVDRCRTCYVSHNTNYKLQKELTAYAIGSETRTTLTRESLHQDPNLNYAASVASVLSRLPRSEKLTPVETMKLAAGEVAGEKSIKTLAEVIDTLNQDPEIINRFGQKGLGQRNLGRAIQLLIESSETNEGKCMFAYDIFKALERIVLDYVTEANDRAKYLEDLKTGKGLYRERIMTEMFNAYMDEPYAIRKDVMNYVNMIIGIDAENLGPDKMWKYKDPQNGELKALKIDERYINSVEERLGLKTEEQRESFRTSIRKIYGQKISVDPDYDFMDNLELVKAVTDVRLKSDIAGAGSLIGALANRTNEENQKLYDRMIETMLNKLGYCQTCAQKTIEYFCTQEDEQ